MNCGLNLKPTGSLDLLSLGALVHRLDPGTVPFRKATECKIHVSGGEYNVAANLADCFRLNTGIATAMADYPIGDLIAERVRAMGVKPFYKHFAHNGVNGPNMATVYSDRGYGVRAPVVFYNRSNEAAALLKPGDFDWKSIFAEGIRWFHSGGIFAALSETTGQVIIEAMKAAKAAGAVTSFDLNFRAKLWKWGKQAGEVMTELVSLCDVAVGNEEDAEKVFGIKAAGADVTGGKVDAASYRQVCETLVERFPNLKTVAITLRGSLSASHNTWSGVLYHHGAFYDGPAFDIVPIVDRVGGGDSFCGGLIYGLLVYGDPQKAIDFAVAASCLKHTIHGDFNLVRVAEVEKLMGGDASGRVSR